MDVLYPWNGFVDQGLGDPDVVGVLLLKASGAPDLSLGSLLVEFLLGCLLQRPDVVHRHSVVTIDPAKHLVLHFITSTHMES